MTGERWKIGELADHSGFTVRNIRAYHQLGLLARPHLVGRTGYYDSSHLQRLELIATLRDRGYSLAAISDLVNTEIPDELLRSVDRLDLLRYHTDASLHESITRSQLEQLFPVLVEQPDLVQTAVRLGVLEPADGGRYRVNSMSTVKVGLILAENGLPLDVALEQLAILRDEFASVGDRFADVMARYMATQDATLDAKLLEEVWPAVLVAVGEVLTEATLAALVHRGLVGDAAHAEP